MDRSLKESGLSILQANSDNPFLIESLSDESWDQAFDPTGMQEAAALGQVTKIFDNESTNGSRTARVATALIDAVHKTFRLTHLMDESVIIRFPAHLFADAYSCDGRLP